MGKILKDTGLDSWRQGWDKELEQFNQETVPQEQSEHADLVESRKTSLESHPPVPRPKKLIQDT